MWLFLLTGHPWGSWWSSSTGPVQGKMQMENNSLCHSGGYSCILIFILFHFDFCSPKPMKWTSTSLPLSMWMESFMSLVSEQHCSYGLRIQVRAHRVTDDILFPDGRMDGPVTHGSTKDDSFLSVIFSCCCSNFPMLRIGYVIPYSLLLICKYFCILRWIICTLYSHTILVQYSLCHAWLRASVKKIHLCMK